MSIYWSTITTGDVVSLFVASEASLVANDESIIEEVILDIVARVRQAVGANSANVLPEGSSIPRSLRQAALAIIRYELLLRYDLEVSESRRLAAEKAEELLAETESRKRKILDEEGNLPSDPSSRITIVSPKRVYKQGDGVYPG